jgi:hypothetical protein
MRAHADMLREQKPAPLDRTDIGGTSRMIEDTDLVPLEPRPSFEGGMASSAVLLEAYNVAVVTDSVLVEGKEEGDKGLVVVMLSVHPAALPTRVLEDDKRSFLTVHHARPDHHPDIALRVCWDSAFAGVVLSLEARESGDSCCRGCEFERTTSRVIHTVPFFSPMMT